MEKLEIINGHLLYNGDNCPCGGDDCCRVCLGGDEICSNCGLSGDELERSACPKSVSVVFRPQPVFRKPIAISGFGVSNTKNTQYDYVTVVVCDDGSIWGAFNTGDQGWVRYEDIPQD